MFYLMSMGQLDISVQFLDVIQTSKIFQITNLENRIRKDNTLDLQNKMVKINKKIIRSPIKIIIKNKPKLLDKVNGQLKNNKLSIKTKHKNQ